MVEKNRNELLGILFRQYPSFVWSDRAEEFTSIPAFVLHDVTAATLEPMLHFLCNNGYTTLTADEYVEHRTQARQSRRREVLLTFDDGLKSLYTVGYPALKRFGLKATAYIVPGRIPEEGGDSDSDQLCTWQAIQEIHESGVVDIQSHSMYHHSISISRHVLDFMRPDMQLSFLESNLAPLVLEASRRRSEELVYGAPIHMWGSRFGGARAFRESLPVVEACVRYVDQHGGMSYFKQHDWRPRLQAVMRETKRRAPRGDFETEAEQRRAILNDFVEAKHEIERRLPGKIVRHFCFPWFCGSALAAELSAKAGYISNAWGSLLPSSVHTGQIPHPVARLLPSYLWRLPGKGRKPLGEVLRERLSLISARRSGYG